MGTWQTFDTAADRGPMVDEALAAGINLFDSSPMYGRAEDTLAQALDGRRDEAIIATKIWTDSESEGREQAEHAANFVGRIRVFQGHNAGPSGRKRPGRESALVRSRPAGTAGYVARLTAGS